MEDEYELPFTEEPKRHCDDCPFSKCDIKDCPFDE